MLTFEFNCPKCNTPIPITQDTTEAECPGCGVKIEFEDEQHVLDDVQESSNIDLYQTAEQQQLDNSGKLNQTITVSFSRADIYDSVPGLARDKNQSSYRFKYSKPGVAKAKRLGSLKVAEPVKDSIFGGAATGASGIFKPNASAGSFRAAAPAKPIAPPQPEVTLQTEQPLLDSSSSLSGASLEQIQQQALQEAQKKLEEEIAQKKAEFEEMQRKAIEEAKEKLLAEAKLKAETQAKAAEEEAKQRAIEEAKQRAIEEAKQRAIEEAKQKL